MIDAWIYATPESWNSQNFSNYTLSQAITGYWENFGPYQVYNLLATEDELDQITINLGSGLYRIYGWERESGKTKRGRFKPVPAEIRAVMKKHQDLSDATFIKPNWGHSFAGQRERIFNRLTDVKRGCVFFGTDWASNFNNIIKHDLLIENQNPRWNPERQQIRAANPNIKIICHHQTLHERVATGPGQAVLDSLRVHNGKAFINFQSNLFPGAESGLAPTLNSFGGNWRFWDYRNADWQRVWKDSMRALLDTGIWDGVFMDNCIVAAAQHAYFTDSTQVRQDLLDSLQGVILDIRSEYPDAILVGNSGLNWLGLNGEMMENSRPDKLDEELTPVPGQAIPPYNCYVQEVSSATDQVGFETGLNLVAPYPDTYFFVRGPNNYSEVLWFNAPV